MNPEQLSTTAIAIWEAARNPGHNRTHIGGPRRAVAERNFTNSPSSPMRSLYLCRRQPLFRRQFFGLVFAFVAEQFQRAFGFFVRGRDLLLHLGCGLLHLLR